MADIDALSEADWASKFGCAASALLLWYRMNKRCLPWRGADAYGVLVSEIMLQQTQVATVVPYYLRFLQRFPTVSDLAAVPLDEVLQLWAGMGYYARARNLHRAARTIVDRYGGIVPNTREELLTLPGVGEYTAGAVLSIAYGLPHAAIDANACRVLCRLFGIEGDPKSSGAIRALRSNAERMMVSHHPGEFNQAVMELGALICDAADPSCARCPLVPACAAGNSSDPTALPQMAPSKSVTKLLHSCVIISNCVGEVAIVQRPARGLWGGMWEFPRVVCLPGELTAAAAERAASEVAGLHVHGLEPLMVVKHSVTRYRISLHAFRAALAEPTKAGQGGEMAAGAAPELLEGERDELTRPICWTPVADLNRYAFSSPQAAIRKDLQLDLKTGA